MGDEESGRGFQATRSQRPRRNAIEECIDLKVFQSTRSQRPRHWRAKWHVEQKYFNPRGRKDLDNINIKRLLLFEISIHEVAKTSTTKPSDSTFKYHISIHEVAKTSTPQQYLSMTLHLSFQPTRSQRPRRLAHGHFSCPK